MAMTTEEERIAILKDEYQRLEHYLHTLSQEDWHHPSTCDQWTVADVIAHLTVGNRSHATWITEALQAESLTPERLPPALATGALIYEGHHAWAEMFLHAYVGG